MASSNTYPRYSFNEIAAQREVRNSYFGLIDPTTTDQSELHGYEVTMSGRLVLPELHPHSERASVRETERLTNESSKSRKDKRYGTD